MTKSTKTFSIGFSGDECVITLVGTTAREGHKDHVWTKTQACRTARQVAEFLLEQGALTAWDEEDGIKSYEL